MKKKFFITTTVPQTLFFFSGQCRELSKIYSVCAVSTGNELLDDFAKQEGIGKKVLCMKRDISLLHDLVSLYKWIILLVRERPNIVHGNTPKAALLSMVAAWLTKVPIRIYMCHGLRYQSCTGLKRKLLVMMERITCCCATHVLCVSQGVRQMFAEDRICSLRKSKVIFYGSANGVDTDFFNPQKVESGEIRRRYGIEDNEFVVTFIGRIVRDKGIEELVSAVERLHNENIPIKLLLIGEREDNLNALSHKTISDISRRDFIIEVGRQQDVRPFLKESYSLVLPSYREGMGQVLLEANAMGIPVIASNIIGCNNVVQNGVNGLLCEPHSIESLFLSLRELITNDTLYMQMKKNCRKYIIEHFERKKVQDAYLEYYNRLYQS